MSAPVAGAQTSWLEALPARLTPLVDLICIPGAGAGTSAFRPWQGKLPAFCKLHICQLPGRETRIDEPACSDLSTVVDNLLAQWKVQNQQQRPVVIFGHSLGAAIGYELALRLQLEDAPARGLVLAASTPPKGNRAGKPLSDAELKHLLLSYDPLNRRVIEDDELFDALAPVLRGDMQLLHRHKIASESKLLGLRPHLWSGANDALVPPDAVAKWAQYFEQEAENFVFDGGHHFPFRSAETQVIGRLGQVVTEIARGTAG